MIAKHPKQRQKPPVVGIEEVVCVCGHKAKFEHFADKQDKYREQRRTKITSRPCAQCRIEAHKKAHPKKQKNRFSQGRLPHGATFHATYDAESKKWTGTLTIEGTVFSDQRGGVWKLMGELDKKYRQALVLIESST